MKKHLSSDEVVDAVERGTLAEARQAHLDACEPCRREVDELRGILMEARDVHAEAPEPSPLFWTHFQQRVRTATAELTPERRLRAWQIWRPLLLTGAAAAAIVLAVVVSRDGGASGTSDFPDDMLVSMLADELATDPADADGDAVWLLVVQMAQDVPVEDLQRVTTPRPGTADLLVEDLSQDERAELVRLLKAEMGGGE
jgi:hypothetical protein